MFEEIDELIELKNLEGTFIHRGDDRIENRLTDREEITGKASL